MSSPTPTVLLVEDEAAVARIARLFLESLGYHVIAAPNGADALARLDENEGIDILFSDIVLPGGMNGRELAEAALARRPELKVLFASGYPREAIAYEDQVDPGLVLVAKPYRRLDLSRALDSIRASAPVPRAGQPQPVAIGL